MPWESEGMQQYNQLHEEVHQDWLLSEGQRFEIQFKKKWNKKQAWHRAEREKQSNRLTWLLYMS
jgi:hypothetical protein